MPGSLDILGPEMKFTGVVMTIGETLEEITIKIRLYDNNKISIRSRNIKLYPFPMDHAEKFLLV